MDGLGTTQPQEEDALSRGHCIRIRKTTNFIVCGDQCSYCRRNPRHIESCACSLHLALARSLKQTSSRRPL